MKKLICFDLDGTLTPLSTWQLLNTELGLSAEDDERLFQNYIANKLSYHDWIAQIVSLYKSRKIISKDELQKKIVHIALREDAQHIIDQTKEKGYAIVIISGSVDIVVSEFAKRLGVVEHLATNTAIFNENDELIDIEPLGDEGDAKFSLLQNFCTKNGYELSEVISVGDGGNDLEIFKHTKGILLGANKELAEVAWKQVDSLSEIGNFI